MRKVRLRLKLSFHSRRKSEEKCREESKHLHQSVVTCYSDVNDINTKCTVVSFALNVLMCRGWGGGGLALNPQSDPFCFPPSPQVPLGHVGSGK